MTFQDTTIPAIADLRELSRSAIVVLTPQLAASSCQVTPCRGLTYAELRGSSGRINVCFKHFEAFRDGSYDDED
jgi:hypothetical protein